MKIGRNDPCHCGSGKKYKKCCLEKDEALEREQAAQTEDTEFEDDDDWHNEINDFDDEDFEMDEDEDFDEFDDDDEEDFDSDDDDDDELNDLEKVIPKRSPEVIAAQDARWNEFEAADDEGRVALFLKTLEEPELMDDDLAFDMLDKICTASLASGDRDRYDDLIKKLRERLPEVYSESAHYHLENLITNAVVAGRWQDVRTFALESADVADREIDTFNNVISQLAYHGQLQILLEITQRAWPKIKDSDEVTPWGIDEFAVQGANFVVFDYLTHGTAPFADDPELQQRLAFFTKIEPQRFTEVFNIFSGRTARSWTMQDFDFKEYIQIVKNSKGKRRRQRHSPGKRNLDDLSYEFFRYLHQHENFSYPKAELARYNIVKYLIKRYDGDLEEHESMLERALRGNRPKPRIKRRPPENILCPDRETLDRYLAGLMHFLNPQYYEVAATFEMVPAWLRFLEMRELIDHDLHRRTLLNLRELQEDVISLFESFREDPALVEAMRNWNEPARL